MISSVIVIFDCTPKLREQSISRIAAHPALEVGKLVDDQKLPVTIDANDNQASETITRWMTSLDGVANVDVVYVHFESDD